MNRRLVPVNLVSLAFLVLFVIVGFDSAEVNASNGNLVRNLDTGLTYISIRRAIAASETLDGHTICVDAGEFYENVVINKAISLLGENKDTTTIDGRGTGSVISIESSNVTVRGFTVRNSGIDSSDGGICMVGWERYVHVEDNNIMNCHEGISALTLLSGYHIIRNNRITECSHHAIYLSGYDNIVEGNTLIHNNYSLTLSLCSENIIQGNNILENTKGIYIFASRENTLTRNNIINNTHYGILLAEYSDNNTISENTIGKNSYGIQIYDSGENIIHHNRFVENNDQAFSSGFDVESNLWHNPYSLEGNYWSNYRGADSDGNGIGENPYYISRFYGYKDNHPLVLTLVDQAVASHMQCNVNGEVTVAFHIKLHPHNRTCAPTNWHLQDYGVAGATVYVNRTRYVTNETGWISFQATYDSPGKRVWVLDNCYQNVETPSTEWMASWVVNFWSLLTQWWFWIIIGVTMGAIVTVNRLRPKPLGIHLEEGEFIIKHFHGGRGLAPEERKGLFKKGAISLGRWYVTNRRLIYEGKIEYTELKRAIVFPLWTKKEPDTHFYPLNELKNIEMVDKGIWHGKYIEATFKDNRKDRQVQIISRNRSEFIRTVQQTLELNQRPIQDS